eukprot:TRINITY_DN8271_c0_g1_i2.p1 TRINITY_DN8271_c0_g1~~TRINITY_DN8271_c0_g1_i2.p1  ORF type:complete len:1578 (-),score=252.91 TRINITY_DN8271_c0_g1_i2:302-5035(-)
MPRTLSTISVVLLLTTTLFISADKSPNKSLFLYTDDEIASLDLFGAINLLLDTKHEIKTHLQEYAEEKLVDSCQTELSNQSISSTEHQASARSLGILHDSKKDKSTIAEAKKLNTRKASAFEVLSAFYAATNGDWWRNNTNWRSEKCFCSWHGVGCNSCDPLACEENCFVNQIHLPYNNLTGFINVSMAVISTLDQLSSLDIRGNQIDGTIPERTFPSLTFLDLSENKIFGTLPSLLFFPVVEEILISSNRLSGNVPSLTNKTSITTIDLSTNNLTGFSSDMISLPRLEILVLSRNNFTGTFPLLEAPSLEYLDASDNSFSGMVLERLSSPALQYMDLGRNEISGNLSSLLGFPQLISAYLSSNQLDGTFPSDWGNSSIFFIDASQNYIEGPLPDPLGLYLLRFLDLASNKLSGTIPNFSQLPYLELLNLGNDVVLDLSSWFVNNYVHKSSGLVSPLEAKDALMTSSSVESEASNSLSGTIPSFQKLPQLSYLDLSGNSLSGTIPRFNGSPKLRELILDQCKLEGTIPSFSENQLLRAIVLSRNKLKGSIPKFPFLGLLDLISVYLNNLEGTIHPFEENLLMRYLDFGFNKLSGQLPEFRSQSSIAFISVCDNQLSGPLPLFSRSPSLRIAVLFLNRFEGTLPRWLDLPSLYAIDVYSNRITGPFPDFSHLQYLRYIHAGGNQLSGYLPTPRSLPTNLTSLLLENNYFEGQLPIWGEHSSIETLTISSNKLEGTLPDLCRYSKLRNFIASGNLISGTIPSFSSCKDLAYLDLSSNMLSGTIPPFSSNQRLVRLDLSENQLTGKLPSNLTISSLQSLLLNENLLTGTLPHWRATNLQDLDVRLNKLSGSLPLMTNMPNLVSVDCSDNAFEGLIPEGFGDISTLRYLNLKNNKFVGPPPSKLLMSPSLIVLDLSCNPFNITIQIALFSESRFMAAMTIPYLSMSNTMLTGKLSLGTYSVLRNVREIDLSYNMIESVGELPSSRDWEILSINSNPITGEIPNSFKQLDRLTFMNISDTKMHSSNASTTYLPEFLEVSSFFSQSRLDSLFTCPEIVGKNNVLTVQMDPEYFDYVYCRCIPGYTGESGVCIKCDDPCICDGGTKLQNCYPSPSADDPKYLYPCPYEDSCNPENADEFSCKTGYEGRLCSKCSNDYYQSGRECLECPKVAAIINPLLSVIFYIMLVYQFVKTNPSSSGLLKIFLFHLQTGSILSTLVVKDSSNTIVFYEYLTSLSTLRIAGPECVFGNDPPTLSVISTLLRIGMVVLFMLISLCWLGRLKWARLLSIVIFLFLNMYYGISGVTFSAFGCSLYDEGTEAWYLTSKPWLQCSPVSDDYKGILGASIPLFIIFTLGFPLYIIFVLKRVIPFATDDVTERQFGFLYLPYEKSYEGWEVVILFRRLLISFVVNIVPYDETSYLASSIFTILQVSVILQHRYNPYKRTLDNYMELSSLYIILFSFFGGLLQDIVDGDSWVTTIILLINGIFLLVCVLMMIRHQMTTLITLAFDFFGCLKRVVYYRNIRNHKFKPILGSDVSETFSGSSGNASVGSPPPRSEPRVARKYTHRSPVGTTSTLINPDASSPV